MGKSRNISQVLNDQGLIEAADLAPGVGTPEQGFNFRNRIINGDMRIDQRNAGASVAISTTIYCPDRYQIRLVAGSGHTAQRVTTAPTGFNNSLKITVGTGASPSAGENGFIYQGIEGYNTADLGWGTANAKTITISFWVNSSVIGTYGLVLTNNAGNRAYVTSYTVISANTWEYKTITIAGDTSGTWETTNNAGIQVIFDIGQGSNRSYSASTSWQANNALGLAGGTKLVATSGATWYITGVQLEVGSVATPFERRPYGTELQLCQRYYQELGAISYTYYGGSGTLYESGIQSLLVSMRTSPSFSTSSINYYSGIVTSMTPTIYNGNVYAVTSVSSTGYGGFYGTVKASAEL
jgi:hypothetical protein